MTIMLLFMYTIGMIVSFVVMTYFDARGNEFFSVTPRTKSSRDFIDVFVPIMFWPMLLLWASYVVIFRLFKRREVTEWRCPEYVINGSYRGSITRCEERMRSFGKPRCPSHDVPMTQD
jgi:hypothetical protein